MSDVKEVGDVPFFDVWECDVGVVSFVVQFAPLTHRFGEDSVEVHGDLHGILHLVRAPVQVYALRGW